MTNQKPKPLFPAEIPPIQLPILSIEEPADRVMPTPVPVVLPLGTIKGGTAYVSELFRSLSIKTICQILVSEEEVRPYELLLSIMYDVSVPEYKDILRDLALKLEPLVELTYNVVEFGLPLKTQLGLIGVTLLTVIPELLLNTDYLVTLPTEEEYEKFLSIKTDYLAELLYALADKGIGIKVDFSIIPSLEVALVLPASSKIEVELTYPPGEIISSSFSKLTVDKIISSTGELISGLVNKLSVSYLLVSLAGTATKYDGYHTGDKVAMAAYKYDGYHTGDKVAMAAYKYDGYHTSSVAA